MAIITKTNRDPRPVDFSDIDRDEIIYWFNTVTHDVWCRVDGAWRNCKGYYTEAPKLELEERENK